jgi:GNAT superfamily N-acetyltransferase
MSLQQKLTIYIRTYADSDKAQVHHNLYSRGCVSMIDAIHQETMLRSPIHWALQSMIVASFGYCWSSCSSRLWSSGCIIKKEWWKIVIPCVALLRGYCWWFMKRHIVTFMVHKVVDKCLNEDLADIPGTYIQSGGTFLVAVQEDKTIVGVVGCAPKKLDEESSQGDDDVVKANQQQGVHNSLELRRLSVDPDRHNNGIGSQLIVALETYARSTGEYTNIYLTCTSVHQHDALAVYKKCGYQIVRKECIKIMGIVVYHHENKLVYWSNEVEIVCSDTNACSSKWSDLSTWIVRCSWLSPHVMC